tara:strand:- start:5843 stop:7357 length:1515 start_codon:yes stop_codon:yes gene_type:complete
MNIFIENNHLSIKYIKKSLDKIFNDKIIDTELYRENNIDINIIKQYIFNYLDDILKNNNIKKLIYFINNLDILCFHFNNKFNIHDIIHEYKDINKIYKILFDKLIDYDEYCNYINKLYINKFNYYITFKNIIINFIKENISYNYILPFCNNNYINNLINNIKLYINEYEIINGDVNEIINLENLMNINLQHSNKFYNENTILYNIISELNVKFNKNKIFDFTKINIINLNIINIIEFNKKNYYKIRDTNTYLIMFCNQLKNYLKNQLNQNNILTKFVKILFETKNNIAFIKFIYYIDDKKLFCKLFEEEFDNYLLNSELLNFKNMDNILYELLNCLKYYHKSLTKCFVNTNLLNKLVQKYTDTFENLKWNLSKKDKKIKINKFSLNWNFEKNILDNDLINKYFNEHNDEINDYNENFKKNNENKKLKFIGNRGNINITLKNNEEAIKIKCNPIQFIILTEIINNNSKYEIIKILNISDDLFNKNIDMLNEFDININKETMKLTF